MSPVPWNGHLAEVTESDTYKTARVRRKLGLRAPIMHCSRNWHATNGSYSPFLYRIRVSLGWRSLADRPFR
ncbi:hypothetical protein chiPu_0030276, partial [Chiloscyllium punctatum]|nr:hypothetical protein [Chiloscyllium punctatum]